jgi:hypothetical protein
MWLAGKTLAHIKVALGVKSNSFIVERAKQIGLPTKREMKAGAQATPELLAAIGGQTSRETKDEYRARVREIADRIVRQRSAEVQAASSASAEAERNRKDAA